MTIKTKSIDFKIKAIGDDKGSFSAYGNTFGNVDHAGDMTMKGAFTKCIQGWAAKAQMPRLLGQHGHTSNPIGIITSMKEDENGLLFEGQFCLETQAGAEAYALVKMGALDMFSIGYQTLQEKMVNGVNELHELNVKEISLVTFACNENSLIQSIKSAVETGGDITPRMVQKALQEAGLSKKKAEAAVNAIKATEVATKSDIDSFKLKAESHVATNCELEVKSDMSLNDYSDMICRAVRSSIESEDTYAYCVSVYMEYVIVCVCDYSDDEYEEFYVKVPYQLSGDDNVMVGSYEKVTKQIMWLNDSELATMKTSMSSGYKAEDVKENEQHEEKSLENKLEDELKSVDISSWFESK